MRVYRGISVCFSAAIAVALCTTSASAVFDSDEQKCRAEVAKNLGKLVKIANKLVLKCHKDQQNGKVANGIDCNDVTDIVNVDSKGKYAKIAGKAGKGFTKKCTPLPDSDVLTNYVSCPVDPCAGVSNNPIQDFDELAACVVCMGAETTRVRNTAVLGTPNPAPTGDDAKCAQAVGKFYAKFVDSAHKDRTKKCQASADKEATTSADNNIALHCAKTGRACATDLDCSSLTAGDTCVGCLSSDEKGKINKAVVKAEAGYDSSCAPLGDTTGILAAPCGDPDPAVAKACLLAAAEAQADEIVLASYELDATICPVGIENLIYAGNGRGVDLSTPTASRTSLEVGWTGLAHPQDLPDRYPLALSVSCATCTAGDIGSSCGDDAGCALADGVCTGILCTAGGGGPSCAVNADCNTPGTCTPNTSTPCGECKITGVDVNNIGSQYFLRCQDDISTPCTLPFQNDPACGGLFCSYFFSGPLPLNAANNPVCVLNRLDGDATGTADVETGEGTLGLPLLRSVVNTGESLVRPCPICAGTCTFPPINAGNFCVQNSECDNNPGDGICNLTNEVPNDGVQGGTCQGGIRNNLPCDIHSLDATFAPTAGTGTSLDCPQSAGALISTLNLDIEFTTGTTSLPFGTKCDGAFGTAGFNCACAMCSGNTSVTCNDNADCAAIGAGTCTGNTGAGAGRQPNACDSDVYVCQDTGDGITGQCPTDEYRYCDGLLRANGEGFLFCTSNADCSTINSVCGGDCGTCSATAPRSCFLDPIVGIGAPDPVDPLLAATFCIPPTTANSVNQASGIPGPARVKVDATVTKKY